jgi:hypothetical protein
MNILTFILLIGLLSQIYAQLDSNYWKIVHPRTDLTEFEKVLEVKPSTLTQQQWDWYSDNYWQHWVIYWTEEPSKKGLIFDRYTYRALTAEDGNTTLKAREIYPISDPRSKSQIWIGIGFEGANYHPWVFRAPESQNVGAPWILNSGYYPEFDKLSTQKENFDPTKDYKILSWSNPLRSLDLAGFVPYVWDTNVNDHQRFSFNKGTCNNQTAYQIINANNAYLIAGGSRTVLTIDLPSGKSLDDEDTVSWWFLNKDPDYYNLAFKIANCAFPGRHLTLPNDADTNGEEFKLRKSPGVQGTFFLRRIL